MFELIIRNEIYALKPQPEAMFIYNPESNEVLANSTKQKSKLKNKWIKKFKVHVQT